MAPTGRAAACLAIALAAAGASPECEEPGTRLAVPGLQVYMIASVEQTHAGAHLSEAGDLRARQVARLMGGYGGSLARFSQPKVVFANFVHDALRTVETVQPLAHALHIPINNRFGGRNTTDAARAILESLNSTGGPVLVAWEHPHISRLIHELGCRCHRVDDKDTSPKWPEHNVDRIAILSFDSSASCAAAAFEPLGLSGRREESVLPALLWSPPIALLVVVAFSVWQRARARDNGDLSPTLSAPFLAA
uniref:Receptor ligand binding region domain-containing protein n=1 Tax=Zooxanthella nutricula TaxID=1333877 RepID=A0A6U6W3M3_9DINO|mmetsp:Transcript_92043/g.281713  ORF Transcript_92043/g.281713 Transcript_92043/m.281713 type:complete len:250 (+) Transcript_92043:31-780(+)